MSDFDEKDIIQDEATGDDFHPDDVIETSAPETVGLSEAAARGAGQGLTLGFGDELGGGVQAAMDKLAQWTGGNSPSQVNKQLSAMGVTGDVGPQSTLDMYRQARDQERQRNELAAKQHPVAYHGAELAGGLLVPVPGAGEIGQAKTLKDAALAGAELGMKFGGIAGLGSSQTDLTDPSLKNYSQAAVDTAAGAATGGAIGATVPVVAKGVGMAVNKAGSLVQENLIDRMLPQTMTDAYKLGRVEGVNPADKQFYKNLQGHAEDLTRKLADPLVKEQEAKQAAAKRAVEIIQQSEGKVQKQADELDQQIKAFQQAQSQEATAQSQTAKEALNRKKVETAANLQKRIGGYRTELKKQFDAIDDEAMTLDVRPNVTTPLDFFMAEIESKGNFPPSFMKTMQKKVQPFMESGEEDPQTFRNAKTFLRNLFENADPVIRRASKQAYGQLNENYSTSLRDAGHNEFADKIANTNGRWKALMNIEDNYVGDIPKGPSDPVLAAPETVRTMEKFAEKTPVQMAEIGQFGRQLGILTPEESPQILGELHALNQPLPEMAQPIAPQVAEQQRLQSLLQDFKSAKSTPDQLSPQVMSRIPSKDQQELQNLNVLSKNDPESFLNTFGNDPSKIRQNIMSKLPSYEQETGKDVSDLAMDELTSLYERQHGSKEAAAFRKELEQHARRRSVSEAVRAEEKTPYPSIKAIAKQSAVRASNVMGRVNKTISDKVVQGFVNKAPVALSEMSQEHIDSFANELAMQGKSGQVYAKMLQESKPGTNRNAVIFSLMQQPEFRKMAQPILNVEDVSEEVK